MSSGLTTKSDGDQRDTARLRFERAGPKTPRTKNPVLRRYETIELLVVLAVFPLGSVIDAAAILAESLSKHSGSVSGLSELPVNRWLIFGIESASYIALSIPAVALVFYLLNRSGEGRKAINLGMDRLPMDLASLLFISLLVFGIPQMVGGAVLAHYNLRPLSQGGGFSHGSPDLLFGILEGICSGIAEEVVVLGFLVRRLEQRGTPAFFVVLIDVIVRVSYHIYQGPGVVPIGLWGLASVLMYLRVRRLLPFIIAHVFWDASITISRFSPRAGGIFILAFVFLEISYLILLWGWDVRSRGWVRRDTKTKYGIPLAVLSAQSTGSADFAGIGATDAGLNADLAGIGANEASLGEVAAETEMFQFAQPGRSSQSWRLKAVAPLTAVVVAAVAMIILAAG